MKQSKTHFMSRPFRLRASALLLGASPAAFLLGPAHAEQPLALEVNLPASSCRTLQDDGVNYGVRGLATVQGSHPVVLECPFQTPQLSGGERIRVYVKATKGELLCSLDAYIADWKGSGYQGYRLSSDVDLGTSNLYMRIDVPAQGYSTPNVYFNMNCYLQPGDKLAGFTVRVD